VEERDAEVFHGWGQDEEICRSVDMIRFPQALEQVKQWLHVTVIMVRLSMASRSPESIGVPEGDTSRR
jgi:hypothetical protein